MDFNYVGSSGQCVEAEFTEARWSPLCCLDLHQNIYLNLSSVNIQSTKVVLSSPISILLHKVKYQMRNHSHLIHTQRLIKSKGRSFWNWGSIKWFQGAINECDRAS